MAKILFKYGCTVAYIFLVILTGCIKIDQTTDLGREVLNDLNPGITDTVTGLKAFSIDSSIVLKSFSIPGPANASAFGLHKTHDSTMSGLETTLKIGRLENEHSIGYIEFSLPPIGTRYRATNKPLKVSIKFQSDSTIEADTHLVEIAECSLKTHDTKLDSLKIIKAIDTLQFGKGISSIISYLPDTLNSDSSLMNKIFQARTTSDSASKQITRKIAFKLRTITSPGLVSLYPIPTIILSVQVDTTIITDEISCTYSDYSVFEDSVEKVSLQPISSFASGRAAVFSISLESLWTAMDDSSSSVGFPYIANAAVKVQGTKQHPEDSMLIDFRYTLSTDTIPDQAALNAIFKTSWRTLKDTMQILPVQEMLQPLSRDRPSSIYLYLQISTRSGWAQVNWNKPQGLEAVLTNFR